MLDIYIYIIYIVYIYLYYIYNPQQKHEPSINYQLYPQIYDTQNLIKQYKTNSVLHPTKANDFG